MGMFRGTEDAKAASAAYDGAVVLQQQAAATSDGIAGTATVKAIDDTGMLINNAPVWELDLTVTVPGRAPHDVKQRKLIAGSALARFQPGATVPVRVDRNDPTKLVLG